MNETYGVDKFLAVAAWSDGDEAKNMEFAETHDLTYPLIAADLGGRFERDGGIPTFVLIGPGHELIMVDQGHPTAADIQAALDAGN